jgi:hypothetical protein
LKWESLCLKAGINSVFVDFITEDGTCSWSPTSVEYRLQFLRLISTGPRTLPSPNPPCQTVTYPSQQCPATSPGPSGQNPGFVFGDEEEQGQKKHERKFDIGKDIQLPQRTTWPFSLQVQPGSGAGVRPGCGPQDRLGDHEPLSHPAGL